MSRSFFAPEVVQTSAMDCGPAALKCLLEGFGIPVSYGRLREACQTDVDGTSIDTVEQIARELGLDCEQVMLPIEDLLLPEATTLPALLVVRQPGGFTHFIVAWRRHGNRVQVMDPAFGRRWIARDRFLADVYRHTATVPASAWREWAASEESRKFLTRRCQRLGAEGAAADAWFDQANGDASWRTFGAIDAATRTVHALVRAGGIAKGREAQAAVDAMVAKIVSDPATAPHAVASVTPAPAAADGSESLFLHGAVLVRVRGRVPPETKTLSRELSAALEEKPTRPARELWSRLLADGALAPAVLFVALLAAAVGVLLEAVLFRSLFDAGRELSLFDQRLTFMGAVVLFSLALLLLELPIRAVVQRMGRRLEIRFRRAFLEKLPRLSDRYFQSRPVSDMASRGHSLHELRNVPDLALQFVRTLLGLAATTAGLIWIDPQSAPRALAAGALFIGVPWLLQRPLRERDLRLRTHVGTLSSFFLDTFLGMVPAKSHGGEPAFQREQEGLVTEWARAGRSLVRAVVTAEALEALVGYGLVAWLLIDFLTRTESTARVLLFVYWALDLPVLGQQAALQSRRYPALRNVVLRLLEPLNALEEPQADATAEESAAGFTREAREPSPRGVAVEFAHVSVRAAGQVILAELSLAIPAGAHVAIVGPSGAGKSSLLGVLLGWHRAARGDVRIDGEALSPQRLELLRREIAWVDPAIQLWNRSVLENLRYGGCDEAAASLAQVVDDAELAKVLEVLPGGLQSRLGEGGALVSGGEGQRMRFARALVKKSSRLVLLDEPFRGLDRERRRVLLERARARWSDATLLCVTHDVGDTLGFERVLVLDGGRIVEDGRPAELRQKSGSLYRSLLDAEREVIRDQSGARWRHLWLERGALGERDAGEGA